MTEKQFDSGYWYALEIKEFAAQLGIPSSNRLRKDELEKAIKFFLRTGKIKSPTQRNLSKTGITDIEKGLSLKLLIVNYNGNKVTKDFIVREAKKIAPTLKKKSGARYRLNRWREEQLTKGIKITYGDLVKQYIKLNQTKEFAKVPVVRYINFLSDFLKFEKNSTRKQAIKAWDKLKTLDCPKTYQDWKNCR
jgi:hypothetical protein